jgi:hypothetical protein
MTVVADDRLTNGTTVPFAVATHSHNSGAERAGARLWSGSLRSLDPG